MRSHRLTAALLFSLGCTNEGSGLTSFTAGPDDTGSTGPDIHGDPVPTTTVTDDANDGQPPGDSSGGDGISTGVDPDDGSGSGPGNDDATGELPPGVIAQGELYPADLIRFGDDLYWANQMDADCIRRVPIAGGTPVDVACEPSNDTFPLQVIAYDGMLAYSYMSTSLGPMSGFGGVRLVDPAGGAPQTIDENSRFKSSSSSPFCNDTLTASGSHLFWYAHELSEFTSSIVHWDGAFKDAFAAQSPFPYGPVATPTGVYWSATEAYFRLPLDGLGTTPTQVGTTVGSTCGRTASGETLYLSSRGTFVDPPALFRYDGGLFSNVRTLAELVYDLDVDATHLYLAYANHVDRLPLADLEGGAAETLVEGPVIGGILVDNGSLYWTDYEGGEVRVDAL